MSVRLATQASTSAVPRMSSIPRGCMWMLWTDILDRNWAKMLSIPGCLNAAWAMQLVAFSNSVGLSPNSIIRMVTKVDGLKRPSGYTCRILNQAAIFREAPQRVLQLAPIHRCFVATVSLAAPQVRLNHMPASHNPLAPPEPQGLLRGVYANQFAEHPPTSGTDSTSVINNGLHFRCRCH